jgi:hypothetical protein
MGFAAYNDDKKLSVSYVFFVRWRKSMADGSGLSLSITELISSATTIRASGIQEVQLLCRPWVQAA